MKWTIATKMGFLFLATVCGAAVALAFFYSYFANTAYNVSIVDVAGRQRMLSQVIHNYVHMVYVMRQDEDRDDLRRFVSEFDHVLESLERGNRSGEVTAGCSSGAACHNVTLPPAPPYVMDEIGEVRRLWAKLKPALIQIADKPVTDPRSQEAFELVQSTIDQLTTASDLVVMAFQTGDLALKRQVFVVIIAIGIIDLLLLIAGVWTIRSYVVERRRVEEKLRDSEVRLNEAQRLAKIGSWECDLVKDTLHWSDEVYRIFDLEPQQFASTYEAFLDTLHPDDRAVVDKAYTDSVKNKTPYNISHRLLLKNGMAKFVNERCDTFYNDAGKAIRSLGTVQDITERKRTEQTQEVLLTISEATHRANTLPHLIETIHQSLSNIMDVTNFYVALYDAESDLYTFPFIVDKYDNNDATAEQMRKGLTDYVRRNEQPLLVDRKVHNRLRSEGEIEQVGKESQVWMGAPLIIHNDVIGVVAMQSYTDAQAYTPADLDTLVVVSSHIADAIERKRAEEILRESEEQYRTLYDASSDAVMLLDQEGIFDCNSATVRAFGCLSKEDLCGKHPAELSPPKQPCGTDSTTLANKHIEKALELRSHRLEWLCQKSDGTQFPCEVLLSTMRLGEKTVLQAVVRDITERKAAEEERIRTAREQRDILNAIQAGIVLIEPDTKEIVDCNPAALTMIGGTMEQIVGRSCPSVFSCIECTDHCDDLSLGQKADILEGELLTIDGKNIPIHQAVSRIMIGGRELLLVTFIDLSEQKKAALEHQELELEMNQARKLEAVGSLAAGIAHEINTPIQFVGDNTNFIADSFKSLMSLIESYDSLWQEASAGGDLASLDSKRVKAEEDTDLEYLRGEIPSAVEQTLDGVQRVTKIVRAMKDFAHSDQGEKFVSDVNDMLLSCLTVSQNELKYVAEVETDLDPQLPDIECYRDDMNQVFLNLLINAAHTIADVVGDASAGKGIITVSTERDDDNVIIKISDTGKGIPQSIQDRIFDPFFSTKDVGKGSGQGLAISRKIVMEKHQGKLYFETEEGKGTTFIIRLPIVSEKKAVEVS